MRIPIASLIALLFAAESLAAPHYARESNDLILPRKLALKKPSAVKAKPVVKAKPAAKPPVGKTAVKTTAAAAKATAGSSTSSSSTGSNIKQAAGSIVGGAVAGEIANLGSTIGSAADGTQTADDATASDADPTVDDPTALDNSASGTATAADDGTDVSGDDGTAEPAGADDGTAEATDDGTAEATDDGADDAEDDGSDADSPATNSTAPAVGTSQRTRQCDQGDQSLAAALTSAVTVGLGLQAATATLQNSTDFTTDLARLAQFSKTMGLAVQMAQAIADDDSFAQPQLKLLADAQTQADSAIAGLKQGDDLTALAKAFADTTNNAQDGAVQALIDCSLPLTTISG